MAARDGAGARWALAKDEAIRDLLLQRAIQTQMNYHMEMHDSFKRQWLERFRSNEVLYHEFYGDLHGIRALNTSFDGGAENLVAGAGVWRGYLEALLAAPPVECMIELSWGNKFSGGSKRNPYINREQAKNYYNATVDPAAVARQLMDVREHLAGEWRRDAHALTRRGDDFAKWATFIATCSANECDVDSLASLDGRGPPALPPVGSADDARARLGGENDAGGDDGFASGGATAAAVPLPDIVPVYTPRAFSSDRFEMELDENVPASTPLRTRNYDLVRLLATRLAISQLARRLNAAAGGAPENDEDDDDAAWRARLAAVDNEYDNEYSNAAGDDDDALDEWIAEPKTAARALDRLRLFADDERDARLFHGRVPVGNSERFLAELLAETTAGAPAERVLGAELTRALLVERARIVEGWVDDDGPVARVADDHSQLKRANLDRLFSL